MTSRAETPLGEHRRLMVELRQARDGLKQTQREVAEALEWSTSKLIRIENGSVGISVTDLRALLLHYGVTEQVHVERLVGMARASKKSMWWHEFREYLPQQFATFLGLEASASTIRQFQGLLVPGLLQSQSYIQTLQSLGEPGEDEIRRQSEIRARRQEIININNGPETFFIVDEAALHRKVGDGTVMREQLLKLKEVTERPNVSIQVMPFSAGVHKGMKGSFEILEFSAEPDDYALLLEGVYRDQLIQIPSDETKEFVQIFAELEKIALPAGETPRVIDERLKQMEKVG